MNYAVRAAVSGDVPVLLAQYARLYGVLEGFGFPFALNGQDLPDLLSAWMQSKLAKVLVAEQAGVLCGFAVVTITRTDRRLCHKAGPLMGMIQDIFVEQGHRGCGCAEQLLAHAEQWLTENGVRVREAFVACENHPSARFFIKQGFGELGKTMIKEV